MTPPRWFYPLVAACLVALTAAVVMRMRTAGRYVAFSEVGVLDTHTGRLRFPNSNNPAEPTCFDVGEFTRRGVLARVRRVRIRTANAKDANDLHCAGILAPYMASAPWLI